MIEKKKLISRFWTVCLAGFVIIMTAGSVAVAGAQFGNSGVNPQDVSAPGGVAVADVDMNGLYSIIWDADGDSYTHGKVDDQLNFFTGGTSRFLLSNSASIFQNVVVLQIPSTAIFEFGSYTIASAPSDGNFMLQNQAQNDFGLLQLGGTTSAFPALARSLAELHAMLADGSDYANLTAAALSSASSKSAKTTLDVSEPTTVTFSGGGDATKTATGFRIAQRKLLGVSGRVSVTGTTCTSIDIGDGSDVDRYGAAIAVADNTVFDIDDATADPEEFLTTAGDIVITANGGDCVDLVVLLTLHYRGYQAATSD